MMSVSIQYYRDLSYDRDTNLISWHPKETNRTLEENAVRGTKMLCTLCTISHIAAAPTAGLSATRLMGFE